MRATVRAAAPEAEEKISYGMPAFALKGNLVYFAALKNHIGFYPTSSGVLAFADELSGYESSRLRPRRSGCRMQEMLNYQLYDRSKGAIRFPITKPLPLDLVTKIVQFRVAESLQKAALKSAKRKTTAAT